MADRGFCLRRGLCVEWGAQLAHGGLNTCHDIKRAAGPVIEAELEVEAAQVRFHVQTRIVQFHLRVQIAPRGVPLTRWMTQTCQPVCHERFSDQATSERSD